MIVRGCAMCGERMPGRRADARTCSTRCRVALHRRGPGIPIEMLERARWMRWRWSRRGGLLTKVPLTVNGDIGSSTNPAAWSTHADAAASTVGAGLGFVLGDGVAGIDLDHCLVDGVLTDGAAAIVKANPGAYIERSPSGDGLHVLGRGAPGPGFRSTYLGQRVEHYSVGRFFTVTGDVWQAGALPPLVTLSERRGDLSA